jgi:hypothetical protein
MSDKDIPSLDDAIEQLAEFFGFDAHHDFKVGDEVYRITYRQFLPADVERKLQEVEKSLEDCDKVELELSDGKTVKTPTLAVPLRRDGELLPESRDALFLQAMWGEKKYRAFEKAGGPPQMLTVVWAKQDAEYEKWRSTGSKSANSD